MIKGILGSQLRLNMASGIVTTIANLVIMLVSYRVYLDYLGYEKYGVWLIVATVLSFLQMGGSLGIEPAVIKLVAEEYGSENIRGIESYVMMALVVLSASGTIGLILILCFKSQIISLFNLTGDNAIAASRLLPYIGLLCIYVFATRVLGATLSGLGRMDLTNYTQLAGRVVLLCVAVSLLYTGLDIESLLIGNIASYAVIHIISVVLIRRISHVHLLRVSNWEWQRLKKLMHFGICIVGGSVANMIFSPFNKMMLSRYAGPASIPVYEIAFRGSMQIRNLIEVGLRALMPEISRIGANLTAKARERIAIINQRAVKLVLFGGIPLVAFGMLIINYTPVLKLWLGSKFVRQLPEAVCIMLFGTVLGLLGVPAYYTLIGLGRVRHSVISHVIQSSLNVTLVTTIALVGLSLSVAGVAWMTAIAMGASTVYLMWQSHRVISHTCA
jgi:O-antigen/teichoic acid export membrane protein